MSAPITPKWPASRTRSVFGLSTARRARQPLSTGYTRIRASPFSAGEDPWQTRSNAISLDPIPLTAYEQIWTSLLGVVGQTSVCGGLQPNAAYFPQAYACIISGADALVRGRPP